MSRLSKFLLFGLAVLVIGTAGVAYLRDMPDESSSSSQSNNSQQPTPQANNEFDKQKYSTSEPGSPWWIANKNRPLPEGYVSPELTVPNVALRLGRSEEQMKLEPRTARALEEMFKAAEADGIDLVLSSGYRSEALQRQFYNNYVRQDGQEAADRYSARPGTSEHQTGMGVDVIAASDECHLEICFADMPEGKWVAENAHKFGFIIRYLEGKEAITGYQFEPWHLRYVGEELAAELHRQNLTMEEFFGI